MLIFDTIARSYAKAIFEIAIENKSIKKWKSMLIFVDQIISYKKFQKFLSGSLSPKYLSSLFIFIAGNQIDHHVKNLIQLLAQNQRLKIFHNILKEFLKLEAIHEKKITIKLISAFPLKKNHVFNIRSILEKKMLSSIIFSYKIDPNILDGIIIKINDNVFDLSIRNYLKQLSNSLNF